MTGIFAESLRGIRIYRSHTRIKIKHTTCWLKCTDSFSYEDFQGIEKKALRDNKNATIQSVKIMIKHPTFIFVQFSACSSVELDKAGLAISLRTVFSMSLDSLVR